MGNTYKDNKNGRGNRRPNKKERREMERLNSQPNYRTIVERQEFKSEYKKLKIEE